MLLTARQLTIGKPQAPRVRDVNLDLPHGLHLILGPNGAGKTSLLRTLATVPDTTWTGELMIGGLNPRNRTQRGEIRRRIGYVPQSFRFPPDFTLQDFVEYIALLKGSTPDVARTQCDQALERLELTDARRKRLKELSGGMLRRAGIAQGLLNNPDVLILDEPTAGLDWTQVERFHDLISSLADQRTLVMSTHLQQDLVLPATSVTKLVEGAVTYHGAPAGLPPSLAGRIQS